MKTIEIFNIYTSIVALLLSCLTLFLTSPLIIDRINQPVLEVTIANPHVYDDRVITYVKVWNNSRSTAHVIKLSFLSLAKDEFIFNPTSFSKTKLIKSKNNNLPINYAIQERSYEIDELPSKQAMIIVIKSNKNDFLTAYKDITTNKASPLYKLVGLPQVNEVYCDGAKINFQRERITIKADDDGNLVL